MTRSGCLIALGAIALGSAACASSDAPDTHSAPPASASSASAPERTDSRPSTAGASSEVTSAPSEPVSEPVVESETATAVTLPPTTLSPHIEGLATAIAPALGSSILVYDFAAAGWIRVDPDGGVDTVVEGPPGHWAASDDGRYLALSTEEDDQLRIIDTQTSTEVAVATNGEAWSAVFAPTGGVVTFHHRTDQGQRQVIFDPSTSTRTELAFPYDEGLFTVSDWSPDGTWLVGRAALSSNRMASGWDAHRVFIVRADGSELTMLPVSDVESGIMPHEIAFSPNGTEIWMSDQFADAPRALWAYSLSDQTLTRRTNPGPDRVDRGGRWWLDSERFAFVRSFDPLGSSNDEIWVRDTAAGTEELVGELSWSIHVVRAGGT